VNGTMEQSIIGIEWNGMQGRIEMVGRMVKWNEEKNVGNHNRINNGNNNENGRLSMRNSPMA